MCRARAASACITLCMCWCQRECVLTLGSTRHGVVCDRHSACMCPCSVKPLEEPDDRTKPGAALSRPPALTTAGSGALVPPASPLGTPGPGGAGVLSPSPKLPGQQQPVPTPRSAQQQQKSDEGPLSPMQVWQCCDRSAADRPQAVKVPWSCLADVCSFTAAE